MVTVATTAACCGGGRQPVTRATGGVRELSAARATAAGAVVEVPLPRRVNRGERHHTTHPRNPLVLRVVVRRRRLCVLGVLGVDVSVRVRVVMMMIRGEWCRLRGRRWPMVHPDRVRRGGVKVVLLLVAAVLLLLLLSGAVIVVWARVGTHRLRVPPLTTDSRAAHTVPSLAGGRRRRRAVPGAHCVDAAELVRRVWAGRTQGSVVA